MKRTFRIPTLAVAVLLTPAAAFGATPKPSPAVGEVLVYKDRFLTVDCQRWEVTELDRDGYRISQCGDKTAYVDKDTGRVFKIVSDDGYKLVRFKPGLPTLSFPMEEGKTWNDTYEGYTNADGAQWQGDTTCEVEARETVTVAAGEFEAYRIACTDSWSAPPFSGESHSTTWYAPEVGGVVKSVNKQDAKWNMELQAYSSD